MEPPKDEPDAPPIPDPFAAPTSDEFVWKFWPMFVSGLLGGWPILALLVLPGLLSDPRMSVEARVGIMALAFGGGAFVGGVSTLIQRAIARVRVGADGIHGHTFWATKRSLRWSEIQRVRPRRFLNLRYLSLHAERGKSLWLPLFLQEPERFRQAVARLAPPENPLRRALESAP
jgi:hypothetical protein